MEVETFKGRLLVATPQLDDPNFARTVVAVLEHAPDEGALGIVLNRPTETEVAEVLPVLGSLVAEPTVVFEGGPVQPTAAVALARPRVDLPAGEHGVVAVVAPQLATVDLDRDPAEIAAAVTALRIYAGYAGWGAGQLEAEVEAGAWWVFDSLPADPFLPDVERLWQLVLRRQGGTLAMVATFPPDPRLN